MEIHLYKNNSDNRNMSKSLLDEIAINGILKDSCEITNPTILIEANNLSQYNYMYIPDFGRYYYINTIEVVRTNLWRLSCHVDVLMTYRASLLNLKGVISRQQNQYNLYLDDGELPIYQNTSTVTKVFPNKINGESYILTVAGGD